MYSRQFLLTYTSLLLAVSAALVVPVRGAKDAYRPSYLKTLREHDIEPTAAGARRYLRNLRPADDERAAIDRLIAQLGHEEFRKREAATNELLRMSSIPIDSLSEAAHGDNAEIRWRSQSILEQAEAQSAHVVLAALKIASAERAEGLVADILAIVPLCRRPFLQQAVHEALRSITTAGDVGVLRRALDSDDEEIRLAATVGLTGALPPGEIGQLRELLDDDDDRVALEAARGIGNRGDRAALPALVRLLDSDDPQVRGRSAAMLQSVSGESLGYAAYFDRERRAEAVARWRTWLSENGESVPLNFPVAKSHDARGALRGNTLIATGSARRVFELAPSGREVWSYPIDSWSAEKLQNGNVLIASYSQNKVLEVDAQGEVVWSLDGVSAMTAKPLHGGNFLVADFSNSRVVEFDAARNEVWEQKTPGECFDADRLPNGNTIFGCPNVIQEVSPDHKEVRKWEISGRLNGFQALPNGNVIVANYGANAVYELDAAGEKLWEVSEPQPCDVFQLPDGRLLVTTAQRVVEFDVDHKFVREICKAQYGSARR
jgi:hypothetical protein